MHVASSPSQASGKVSGRVLLVDDDDDFLDLLGQALREDGHAVTVGRSGAELVQHVTASMNGNPRFDLVLSDIRMPGGTGLQALRTLRQFAALPPVLLMTAFGSEDTHDTAACLGAVGVIDKPFDIDDLRVIVLYLVQSGRAGALPS